MLKIYGFETFNVLKVVVTAECLEIPYEYVYLDPKKGEHKTPTYLKLHPMGKVPVIEWDDKVLFESDAICRYLANRADKMYGENIWERALVDQSIDMSSSHQGKWFSKFFWEEVIQPKFGNNEKDLDGLKNASDWLEKQLPIYETQLEKGGYLVSTNLSIADVIAWSYCSIAMNTSYELEKHKTLYQWYKKLNDMVPFQKAIKVVYP